MIKCSKELVMKYISGEDITEYPLEDLENDFSFMQQVIETTNDKRIYSLCSEELQNDYRLVKYVVDKFNNDEKFICKTVDNYIDDKLPYIDVNEDYNRKVIELSIIMSNILKNKKGDDLNKYSILVAIEYNKLKEGIEKIKNDDNSDDFSVGMGFILIKELYNDSTVILDYFAKRIIEEIMVTENIEKYLHKKYNKLDSIKKSGKNTLAINYISAYDECLANYISADLSIIKSLTEIIKMIIRNWDEYNKKEEAKMYDLILEKFYEYMENDNHSSLNPIDLLHYVARQLNIEDKLNEYNKDFEDKVGYYNTSNEQIELQIKNNIHNKRAYKDSLKLIKSIINNTYVEEDPYILAEAQKKKVCKILDFDNRKANN